MRIKYIVYLMVIIVIIGGGLRNLQRHSIYWPNSHGELSLNSLIGYLLFIFTTSLILSVIFGGGLYLWSEYRNQLMEFNEFNEFYDIFFIILIFISIPILWIIPAIV